MNVGSSTILIDTNVLVYAHDPRDRRKQERALAVLDRLMNERRVVLSVRCLSEFFSATTRRLPEPLPSEVAQAQVERFVRACRILDLTAAAVLEGCRGASEHSLSIRDALIWATAKLNQVPLVLSEDFVDGGFLEGVRFLNPFAPAFDLSWWLADWPRKPA